DIGDSGSVQGERRTDQGGLTFRGTAKAAQAHAFELKYDLVRRYPTGLETKRFAVWLACQIEESLRNCGSELARLFRRDRRPQQSEGSKGKICNARHARYCDQFSQVMLR